MTCRSIIADILKCPYKVEVVEYDNSTELRSYSVLVYTNKDHFVHWVRIYQKDYAIKCARELININFNHYDSSLINMAFDKSFRIQGQLVWSSLDDL